MALVALSRVEPVYESHRPVLRDQVLELLLPAVSAHPDAWIVDGTLGAGGHAEALLQAGARVFGIDRDPSARALAAERLAGFGDRVRIVAGRHEDVGDLLDRHGIDGIAGLLLDLGVSSMQLDQADRGFSLRQDGPLDMRMNTDDGPTAADLVNDLDAAELADLIYRWGEERASRRIAREIVKARPIETTGQLVAAVERALGPAARRQRLHPATRTFQALRVATNREIEQLADGLATGLDRLLPGGRAVVIAYHSLEDRPVKQLFRQRCGGADDVPRHLPVQPEADASFRLLTRRAIQPDDAEIDTNPRSRSARLRAVERL